MVASGQLRAPLSTPWEWAPGVHWIGGCVGTKSDLETAEKSKISSSSRNRTPARRYTVSAVATRTTYNTK
jgi:hypothetical protein